jgi:hypothetical protein
LIRQKEAHERRERLHALFYGVAQPEKPLAKEVNINFENLSTSEERVQGPHPAAPLPDDDHSTHTTDDDIVSLAYIDHQPQQVSLRLRDEQLRLVKLVLSGSVSSTLAEPE